MIYFCGYPVRYNFLLHGAPRNLTADFEPCGKPATLGHAFCDEHGKLFEQENIRLTEQDIVDRAAAREETGEYLNRWLRRWTLAGLIVCLVGLFRPVHTWLHGHLELLLGFLLGTLAQSIPWLLDRWRWLKWFSWQ